MKKPKFKSNNHRKVDNRKSIDIQKQYKKVDTGLHNGVFIYSSPLTIENFAAKLNKSSSEIIKHFFLKGKATNLSTLLSEEEIGELCLEFNYDFEKKIEVDETNLLDNLVIIDDEKSLIKRAPIITIMGHVDHGKTTLLDAIRHSHVVTGEFGGITQHIGAYQITYNNEKITFIDTPGHEAFTEMRARGANATDMVVLVVAADDGIKPQTEEAIDHARAANVPIIVFINKIDKPNINIDRVLSQLSEKQLMAEEWGGSTIFVKGSALTKKGINELLDSILVLSEMQEYKANPNRLATGVTIEAKMDIGHGPIATILIKNGTLQKGDYIAIGSAFGKIRALFDDNGKEIALAIPSQPVKITGLSEVPMAGTKFVVLANEGQTKDLAKKIKDKESYQTLVQNFLSKSDDETDSTKKLNIIIRADVQGSLEAIKGMLSKIEVEGSKLILLRTSVGAISESDVSLAKASSGIIIGFNIKPSRIIKDLADNQKIKIMFYNIIYKLKEDVTKMLYGNLDPVLVEEELGEALVKQIWKHSNVGAIAGCIVTSGEILRNAQARVIRDGVVIYTTTLDSLKHLKENVNKVSNGKECGILLHNFNDIKENDVIQVFKSVEKTFEEVQANEKK